MFLLLNDFEVIIMSFTITASQYMDYIKIVAKRINENGEYISSLDAITGDGDHWANINMGFQCLVENDAEIRMMPFDNALKRIGMLMMSKVGGSSGILYGGAYIAASNTVSGKLEITGEDLCSVMEAMVKDMMSRGKAEPGYKTMIDALYPAVEAFKSQIPNAMNRICLPAHRSQRAAEDGNAAARSRPAIPCKGRARQKTPISSRVPLTCGTTSSMMVIDNRMSTPVSILILRWTPPIGIR